MPIPVDSDYYLQPLQVLFQELTPDQRTRLADWITLVGHYARELTARIELAERLSHGAATPSGEADDIMVLALALHSIGNNADALRTLFDDLDRAVLGAGSPSLLHGAQDAQ